jgi:hypothetical protein
MWCGNKKLKYKLLSGMIIISYLDKTIKHSNSSSFKKKQSYEKKETNLFLLGGFSTTQISFPHCSYHDSNLLT